VSFLPIWLGIACSDAAVMNPLNTAGGMATITSGAGGVAVGAAGALATAAGSTGSAGTGAITGTGAAGVASSVAGSSAAAGAGAVAGATATAGSTAIATAGASGAAPIAGAGGGAGSATSGSGAPPEMHMDLGKGDGSDVITIGDSWMSYVVNGGGIEAGLAAASMQRYRNYGVAGTMLLDEVIPNQYESAKRSNPKIKTVVMTGGGNDLLLTGMSGGATCSAGCMSTIEKVGMRLSMLWEEMKKDGVEDVVYIEYSRGGTNGPSVEYGVSKVKPACAAAPLRCHFVDSDPIIMMQLLDGVHPTPDGCTKIGKAVFDLMVEKGMRR
jgi:hypothetical protein